MLTTFAHYEMSIFLALTSRRNLYVNSSEGIKCHYREYSDQYNKLPVSLPFIFYPSIRPEVCDLSRFSCLKFFSAPSCLLDKYGLDKVHISTNGFNTPWDPTSANLCMLIFQLPTSHS